MRMRTPRLSKEFWYSVATVAAIILGTFLYLSATRPLADRSLAGTAARALHAIESGVPSEFPNGGAQRFSEALGNNTEMADLFLISDSGLRMPKTRDHVEGALLMFTVANEVWIAHDNKQDRPAASDIAGLSSAIARSAELQDLTSVDASGTLRLDNSDMRAVSLLLTLGQAETEKAEASATQE